MSKSKFARIIEDMEMEGIDYALNYYCDYSNKNYDSYLDDEKFQILYKAYKDNRKMLIDYLGVDE